MVFHGFLSLSETLVGIGSTCVIIVQVDSSPEDGKLCRIALLRVIKYMNPVK